jgi:shikimate kinase
MIVVLMGYMGSGKSTVGKDLAKVLDYDFIDIDNYISDKEKSSISNIFKNKGEIYFRKSETKSLIEITSSRDNIVLALGGGTPCYGNNLAILKADKNIRSFYLKLSIPQLTKRLFVEREERPLISHINSEEQLQEFIGKHLFERTQYYRQAQFVINSDNKSKKDILEELVLHLI